MDSHLHENTDEIVSFTSEQLIMVDSHDREVGYESKIICHEGQGILHRALSLFIFNSIGELLIQRRSGQKLLWPNYWSNSCCSHPRRGETTDAAAHRRLEQELRLTSELRYLYKFQYQARFGDIGSEHELCWVYIGKSSELVHVNSHEISDWRYISPARLNQEIAEKPEVFTPWFKMEWKRINRDYASELEKLNHAAQAVC